MRNFLILFLFLAQTAYGAFPGSFPSDAGTLGVVTVDTPLSLQAGSGVAARILHSLNDATVEIYGGTDLNRTHIELNGNNGALPYDFRIVNGTHVVYHYDDSLSQISYGHTQTYKHNIKGYVGIGSAPGTDTGLRMTGMGQVGTSQWGILLDHSFSGATATARGIESQFKSAAVAETIANANAFYASSATLGATSTITRLTNFGGVPQTVATNNAFLADNSAYTGDFFIHQVGTDSNQFAGNMGFYGTAPVAKQSAIAVDAGSSATAVNLIITALENYGLLVPN